MADVTAAGSGGAGLGTRAARWALGGVWLLGIVAGALEGVFADPRPVLLAGYAIALVTAYVLTTPGDRTLDAPRAWTVIACSLVTAWALFASGPPVERIWLFDFVSYLVALLLARGNVVVAGAGAAALIGSGLGWAIAVGGSSAAATALVTAPLLALAVGIVWRLALRRIVARERFHRTAAARSALRDELANDAAAADRHELAEIRDAVEPLLAALAGGEAIDDRAGRELAVVEAGIRDRIRSPWVLRPDLTAMIAERRGAGVDVLLLGERPGVREAIHDGLADALRDLVSRARRGSVTIHAMPPGRDASASVLLDDGETVVRHLLSDEGVELSRR